MTLKELQNKVYNIGVCCGGQFEVVIVYRNKLYRCESNNTLAYDALKDIDENGNFRYTIKQALKSLYDECKIKNDLK